MEPLQTNPADPQAPAPSLDATLLYDPELEMGDGSEFPFTLYNPHALFRARPQIFPTESNFAEGGSSSFPAGAHPPPPINSSPWNDVLSGNIGVPVSSPLAGPSESPVYGSLDASRDHAVVTGSQSILPHERDVKIRGILPYTGEEAIPARSHPGHVELWYHVYSNAVVVSGPRNFVPQTIYQPHSQGDKERYVSLAKLHPPIIFLAQDSPEWGIPIQHLLYKQSVDLVDGSKPAFMSCGPSIGIRVQWPGYQPCHKQVPTKDYTYERRMISRERLAKVVAKSVKQFMDAMANQVMQVGSDRQWKVGPLNIRVDDILLVSLHHVSQGSWQPQLRLSRTISPNVVQDRIVIPDVFPDAASDTRISMYPRVR